MTSSTSTVQKDCEKAKGAGKDGAAADGMKEKKAAAAARTTAAAARHSKGEANVNRNKPGTYSGSPLEAHVGPVVCLLLSRAASCTVRIAQDAAQSELGFHTEATDEVGGSTVRPFARYLRRGSKNVFSRE